MRVSVGFAKRVLERLMTIPPSTKICLYSPPKRTQSAWVGGCLLATLSPFKNMWIMKEEYEEEGVNWSGGTVVSEKWFVTIQQHITLSFSSL